MDSLTHVLLGATIAKTFIGKKAGKKAMVIGAIAGNIPDSDVIFTPLYSPIDALFIHRGFSHSVFLLVVAAPILAYILYRYAKSYLALPYGSWLGLIALPWLSHLVVDLFNTYGTAIFEPFSNIRPAYDCMAIIDATLWLILAIPVIVCLTVKEKNSIRIAGISLIATGLYFSLAVYHKVKVEQNATEYLSQNGISHYRLYSAPIPLTNREWMILAEDKTGYNLFYHNIASDYSCPITHIERTEGLTGSWDSRHEIAQLIRFSRGFYTIRQVDKNTLQFTDLRFASLLGSQATRWPLQIRIAIKNGKVVSVNRPKIKRDISMKNARLLYNRLTRQAILVPK